MSEANLERIAISLGGTCECKYQIDRLELRSTAVIFDWMVWPTTSVVKVIENDFQGLFERTNVVHRGRWDDNFAQVEDIKNKFRVVHDLPLNKNLDEYYHNIRSKISYLSGKSAAIIEYSEYLVVFHKLTECDWQTYSGLMGCYAIWQAIKDIRKEHPFHLVVIVQGDEPFLPVHSTNISWYRRPAEQSYNWQGDDLFWDNIKKDLIEKGVLTSHAPTEIS